MGQALSPIVNKPRMVPFLYFGVKGKCCHSRSSLLNKCQTNISSYQPRTLLLISTSAFSTKNSISIYDPRTYNFANNFVSASKERETIEFSDVCRYYLGRWGDWAALAFSLCAIFGALIVFYVLMSNFLYNAGRFIHGEYSITFQNIYRFYLH